MLLLIFLLFFLKHVQTCLVVQSGPYIEMNNCKCEPLRFTTKEDIEANKYSAYLANRPLFQANVTVRDNCMIGIPVQDRMTSYFFMIFRTNGPPIFHTRLHAHMEDPTRLIAAVGFDCVLQEDGEYKWQYGGGVVENPTLTYQSNEDECTCGTFPGSTSIEGFCDVVDVVCPKSTDAAYWISTNLAFNLMLPKLGNPLISDLLCVSERWHYMGIPLSNVQLTCSDPVSIVDMHSPAPNTNCLCFDIIRITSDNNYMSVYDMDGEFADYTLAPVTFTRDLDCNIPAISCDGDDLMVVFSRNYQPMKFSPGSAPYLMCSKSQAEPSWLRPGSQNASFYWYFDGIMLAEPAVACLSNSSEKINMNGCKCPQIELADKAGVLANPLSAYLANRDIFYPYTVNVTESCEVTVDAPASCEYDDYYFMIFRTNGPPIFNHRFVKELTKDPFNPTGLTCEKIGDSYEWQFYGGKLENMSFALQSNDGMCGCFEWANDTYNLNNPASAVIGTEYLYGTCDIIRLKCPQTHPIAVYMGGLFQNFQQPGTMEDTTCVDKNWYINGVNAQRIDALCFSESLVINASDTTFPCGCQDFLNIRDLSSSDAEFFVNNTQFANYTVKDIKLTYSSESGYCSPDFQCSSSETLVIYSMSRAPLVYENGARPNVQCHKTPLALSPDSMSYWYVDGVMLNFVVFGCYSPNYCPCSFEYMDSSNIQQLVGFHPNFEIISAYNVSAPNDNCVPDDVCPDIISCPKDKTLAVFDSTKYFLFQDDQSISCDPLTRQWTIDDYLKFDSLYATCVDYPCQCPVRFLDDSNLQDIMGYNPFYQNVSKYPISAPLGKLDWRCPDKVVCPDGLMLVNFGDYNRATLYPNGSVTASCIGGVTWDLPNSYSLFLHVTCVNYGCSCSYKYLDESNIRAVVGTHPYYQNISGYAISAPDDSCVPNDVCPDKIVCPAGLTLVIFDTDSATTFPNGSIASSCSGAQWSVNGAQFNRLFATCVDYSCGCSFEYMDKSNIEGLVGTHPFYQNISEHTISAPDDNCVPDNVCPDKIVCPAGLTLVVFDTDTATTFPNGSLSSSCSEAKWSVNGALFSRLFATCVDYGCSCSFKYLDESNIQDAVGTHPFYQNISEHTISAPDDNCVPDDVCPDKIVCPAGLTLVIFDTDSATSYPNGSLTSSCSASKWSVNGAQFSRLFATCVDYGCSCSFKYLDESNIQDAVGTHPFYQNISEQTISAPDDNCVPDDICPDKIVCPAGLTLVIFDTDSATTFPNGSLASTCSGAKWSVNGAQFSRLYATCVDYGCPCSFEYMDQSNIQELVGTHPFYQNISHLTISAPNDNCVSDDVCPESVTCPTGLTLVIFGSDSALSFPSHVPSTCSNTTKQWTIYNTVMDRLYATCVDFVMNGCKCAPIKQLNSSLIGGNSNWAELKNEKIWDTSLSYDIDCNVMESCAGVESSYYTAFFYTDGLPIVINRVINNNVSSPRLIDMLECVQTDNSYQWQLYGYPLQDPSITCVSDMNSCKCPVISGSDKLGEAAVITDRTSGAACGIIEASCPSGGVPKLVSDNLNPISPQGSPIFDDLRCVTKDDGGYQWKFGSLDLINPAISCLKQCACGDLLAIIGKTDLSVYDPSGHFSTYQITPGTWNYQNCAASVNLTCPTDFEPFVFGNGIDYVQVTTKLISCVNNPAAGNMKMWMTEGRRVLDPAVACLKKP